jgi:HlyD family secretion protein
MRTLIAVVIGVVLLSAAISNPERTRLPTVSADTVTIREVRRGSEIGAVTELGDSRDALLVERPVDAREGAKSSVFVVDDDGVLLRRVPVGYGRASASLIQIVSGVSPGARIVVSDMRAWDAFDRLRLRVR